VTNPALAYARLAELFIGKDDRSTGYSERAREVAGGRKPSTWRNLSLLDLKHDLVRDLLVKRRSIAPFLEPD